MANVQELNEDEIVAYEEDLAENTWTSRVKPKSIKRQKSKKRTSRSRRDESPPTTTSRHKKNKDLSSDDDDDDKTGNLSDGEGDKNVKFLSTSSKSDIDKKEKSIDRQTHHHNSHSPTISRSRRRKSISSSGENSDLETFISFKALPQLTRVEPNSRGHFVTSAYKYDKLLSALQIRVRLLKYPSLTQRTEWADDLLVLEDRIFSWQEKIFSKSEFEFYMNKKNIITDVDDQYHKELINNPGAIGKYFYSHIQSDLLINAKDKRNPTIRRCANKHSRQITKSTTNLLDTKLVNSDGESVVDDGIFEDSDYQRSIIPTKNFTQTFDKFKSTIGGTFRTTDNKKNGNSKLNGNSGEMIAMELRQNLTLRERQKELEMVTAEEIRQRKQRIDEEHKEKILMRKKIKEIKTENKKNKLKQEELKKISKENEYVKRWVGSQRPSVALSARMKSRQMTPLKSPKLLKKSEMSPPSSKTTPHHRKVNNKEGSDDIEKQIRNQRKNKLTRRDSLEEILEPRILAEQSNMTTDYPNYSVNDFPGSLNREDLNPLTTTTTPKKTEREPDILTKQSSAVRTIRSTGLHHHRKGIIKSFRSGSQSMYIMVSIPHMIRRKRNVIVCALQTCPKAGVLLLKPDFGYRIIEAKRNHVYRLSWELLTSNDEEKLKGEKDKNWHTRFGPINDDKENVRDDSLLGAIGEMFEMVCSKEMRLVVMGEILSTQGFEKGPVCVHYFIEIPKGWRNDSVSSSLTGITHSCQNNSDLVAHFSHHFFCQLAFSMDSVDEDETYPRPMLILMVVALVSPSRIRHEGYAYVPIPSQPGSHEITIQTWKPEARTIRDKMLDVFLDITPSLQDIRAVHIPINENEECRRPNRLGLQTIPSGFIKLRLHVLHQTHSNDSGQLDKLDLLEKMSSATILRSVQTVIAAFQQARKRAANAKGHYN